MSTRTCQGPPHSLLTPDFLQAPPRDLLLAAWSRGGGKVSDHTPLSRCDRHVTVSPPPSPGDEQLSKPATSLGSALSPIAGCTGAFPTQGLFLPRGSTLGGEQRPGASSRTLRFFISDTVPPLCLGFPSSSRPPFWGYRHERCNHLAQSQVHPNLFICPPRDF